MTKLEKEIFELKNRIAELENECGKIKFDCYRSNPFNSSIFTELIKENEENTYTLAKYNLCIQHDVISSRKLYLYRVRLEITTHFKDTTKIKPVLLQYEVIDINSEKITFTDGISIIEIPLKSAYDTRRASLRKVHNRITKELSKKVMPFTDDWISGYYLVKHTAKYFDLECLLSYVLHEIHLDKEENNFNYLANFNYNQLQKEICELRNKLLQDEKQLLKNIWRKEKCI